MSLLEYRRPVRSLLDHPGGSSRLDHPSVRSSALCLDELEDAFREWAHDPAKPDVVDLDRQRQIPMVELARRVQSSQATLDSFACMQIGLPAGVTIATAAATLLHATVHPDGPHCRSFRAASYYLRGLAHINIDLATITGHFDTDTATSDSRVKNGISDGR